MTYVLGKLLHIVILAGAALPGLAAVLVWAERRVSAFIQDRLGPNRVGPAGLLQPIADLLKFIFKEDVIPGHVNKTLYVLAPAMSLVPALVAFCVVPYARGMAVADVNVGILLVFAISSIAVYGVSIGGWAGNSKYSLLGGVRASAQMISYELALGASCVPVFLVVGELNMEAIVAWQKQHTWLVFYLFPAWIIFLVSSYAETNRLPFDLPEAETELVAGYHTEYSSMKFALFFLAEYIHMITASALSVTLFFGGYELPFVTLPPGLWGTVLSGLIFFAKISFFLFLFIWVRWTLPRFRYDQLMHLGWKILFPASLVMVLLTAGYFAMVTP
ncbi:MAG TPA: NADH-quinone oxidoreductase subunit NuoH [Planctomycetota bacterium]|nr:NADH-quinone oxidoreductase subunit NuoH [Planctomycetota bacterium]